MIKKLCFLVAISLLIYQYTFSQISRDTINVKGNSFWYRGNKLNANQLLEKMQNNEAAYAEMSIAKSKYDVAMVFSCAGGFCIGYPIGQAIGGGKPVWALAGVGVAAIAVAIPLSIGFNKHAKNAVRIYNTNLTRFGLNNLDMKLEFTIGSIGLLCSF